MALRLRHIVLACICIPLGMYLQALDNLTPNDPNPLFSSIFPYNFLSDRQKAYIMQFEYEYPVDKFRIDISPYRQSANRGRNGSRVTVNLGDLPNGRWNMLGLFYDQPMRDTLFQALGLNTVFAGVLAGETMPSSTTPCEVVGDCTCYNLITLPRLSDPNKEFGFFTIPTLYRKYGVRFESQILFIDRCSYAVGLQIQTGVADIRQTVIAFQDLTPQALGIAYPGFDATLPNATTILETCALPNPVVPTAVTPPFINLSTSPVPLCPATPTTLGNCVQPPQTFQPLCNEQNGLTFDTDCKTIVIDYIMSKKQVIADILGIDLCSYHRIGLEDLRLNLFWRQLFIINDEADIYPRLIFMPFATFGVGLPMDKAKPTYKPFALPIGNNDHVSVGASGGFTLDFPDTIEIFIQGGFSHFFKHGYCNYRLPTNVKESGIFPYAADVIIHPGTTWNVNIGMQAYHFVDNLTFWAEYVITSHGQDKIEVCRSFIPSTSMYYKRGFLTEIAEVRSKWENHMVNAAFNYDLSDHLVIGLVWQAPVKQRNSFRSGTILGTLSFVY